jgi:hypothetical protein
MHNLGTTNAANPRRYWLHKTMHIDGKRETL